MDGLLGFGSPNPSDAGTVRGHTTRTGRLTMIRTLTFTLALAVGLLQASAFAADSATRDKPSQQSKMKTCNAEAKAKSLKGPERKGFMSECLKAK